MPRQDDSLSSFKHANGHLTDWVLRGGKCQESWGLALSMRHFRGLLQGSKQVGLALRKLIFGEGDT